jgi:Ca2+-binding RTX toxin-like protein
MAIGGLIQRGGRRHSRAALGVLLLAAGLALAPAAEARLKVTFSKRILTVKGGAKSNRISVFCTAGGKVRMNGRNPNGGPVACSRVVEIDVFAGGGSDHIDMRGVGPRFGDARFRGFGTGTGVAVIGGPGNDRMIGSRRAFNLFLAGRGNDRGSGGRRRDILSGGAGADQFKGHGGRDTLLGKGGPDSLNGGDGRDLVSGNAGDDGLRGGPGNDVLGGGFGNDRLRGGRGDDRLLGGPGKDLLIGGPGRDTLIQDPPTRR